MKAHEILDRLPELGVTEKKTHSSSIDEDVAIKLRRLYGFGHSGIRTKNVPARPERAIAYEEHASEGGQEEPEASHHVIAEAKPEAAPSAPPAAAETSREAEPAKAADGHGVPAMPIRPPLAGRPIHPPIGGHAPAPPPRPVAPSAPPPQEAPAPVKQAMPPAAVIAPGRPPAPAAKPIPASGPGPRPRTSALRTAPAVSFHAHRKFATGAGRSRACHAEAATGCPPT